MQLPQQFTQFCYTLSGGSSFRNTTLFPKCNVMVWFHHRNLYLGGQQQDLQESIPIRSFLSSILLLYED